MQIVTENAEKQLYGFVEEIRHEANSWECVHIGLSRLQTDMQKKSEEVKEASEYKEIFYRLIESTIYEPLKQEDGKVFICADNDAFVVLKPSSKAILDKLYKLADLFVFEHLRGIYAIYNLGKKHDHVMMLARAKIKVAAMLHIKTLMDDDTISAKIFDLEQLEIRINSRKHRIKNSILLVDDDKRVLEIMRGFVPYDCKCHIAVNGKEAVLKYIQEMPDIVFMDLHMPDMDGIETFSLLKDLDDDVCVVMISASSNPSNVMLAKNVGAVGFMAKPFTEEMLHHYINKSPTIYHKVV